ncbi:monovalent cation/H(+) antiporter subunit G [Alphaproteobacteria bacterium]|jgi:multicomponent Na+:H+ antiporter subunit G|nr:monovalent cation/H(+) antiporter subunit G [Alphaproteobacteria bacterium]
MDAQLLISVLSGCFILLGVLALLIGALGLLRLPDVYCRIHAVGMIDTAGASFIILGLAIHEGVSLVTVKLLFIGIFLFFTSPIATHAVAQVAHKSGVVPVGRNLVTAKAAKKPAAAPAAAKAKPKQAAKTGTKVSRKSRGAS